MKVPLLSVVSLAFSVVIIGYISSSLRLCRHLEEVAYDHMSARSLSQISGELGDALVKELYKINLSDIFQNATRIEEVLELGIHNFDAKVDKTLGSFEIACDISISELRIEDDAVKLMASILLTDNRRGVSFLRTFEVSLFENGD